MTGEQISSTHPPLPPTKEEDRFAWLRLLRSRRVGVSTFWRLLREYGSAQAALDALPEIARTNGMAGYSVCSELRIEAEFDAARIMGARLICHGSAEYPSALAEIDQPPPLLWCMGDTGLLSRPMIAMVGARNASSLGTRMARRLSHDLSEAGFVIVSGMARGVDATAHHAALQGGTIAVMAGGVNVIYPIENAGLADDIGENGLRLSDQPMNLQPQARHFPARNRIISGLCKAVVVVEAAAKSGSQITARYAAEQGREVLAVPGHPFDARAAGCNMLLRDGALLVRNAQDVLDHIGTPDSTTKAQNPQPSQNYTSNPEPNSGPNLGPNPEPKRSLRETAALHSEILARLGPSPIAEDQLIRDLGAHSQSIAPALVSLEMKGEIIRQAGGLLSRAT